MSAKTLKAADSNRSMEDVKSLFSLMNILAWIALSIGIVMSLWNLDHFSDKNLTLMLGIGFMVGSVFIYTIGTAIHLVHKRKVE